MVWCRIIESASCEVWASLAANSAPQIIPLAVGVRRFP
jgi:hypothetical protein